MTSILVALDGSEFAERAIPFALAIGRRACTGARVQFVHVHEDGVLAQNAPMTDSRWEDEQAARMDAAMQELATQSARASDLDVTAILLRGPITRSLLGYAEMHGSDLLVATTHGRSGFGHAWFGSVAERIVHEATMPVLVVRGSEHADADVSEPLFRHVLLPIDRASSGAEAMQWALSLGIPGETTYTLLTVLSPPPALPPPFSDPGVHVIQDDQGPRLTAEAGDVLERLAAPARAIGAETVVRVVTDGRTAPAILEILKETGADLVVLPTHQRGYMTRTLLDTVADKVMRRAMVPLFLFRAKSHGGSATQPGTRHGD